VSQDVNEAARQAWLKQTLAALPAGSRMISAGAGELKNRRHCSHLEYVSRSFRQYEGQQGGAPVDGLQTRARNTSRTDLVSDITAIPAPDASFDAIPCSEVLEHVVEPTHALDEFARLLKPGGMVIITAPLASNVHMAPFHYCAGFSRYWYEHHLSKRGFQIQELAANGDWYALLREEIGRLGGLGRSRRNRAWPLAYAYALIRMLYFKVRAQQSTDDLACFGWHRFAVKQT
jgi:SAM-dependent methyltransferase